MVREINAINHTGTTVLQDAVRQVTNSDSQSALFVSTSFEKLVKAVTVHPQHSGKYHKLRSLGRSLETHGPLLRPTQ